MLSNTPLPSSIFSLPQELVLATAIGLLMGFGAGGFYLIFQSQQRIVMQSIKTRKAVSFGLIIFSLLFGIGVLLLILSLITLFYLHTGIFDNALWIFLVISVILALVIMIPAIVIAKTSWKRVDRNRK